MVLGVFLVCFLLDVDFGDFMADFLLEEDEARLNVRDLGFACW